MKIFSENRPFAPKKIPFFYGFVIMACSVLGIVFSAPGQTIGVSVFTDFLIEHLRVSRFQLSIAYAIGTIGSALIIGKAGKLLDTIGPRIISFFTAIALGLSLFYMSQVDRIADFVTNLVGQKTHFVFAMFFVIIGFLSIRFLGQGLLTLASRTMLMKWFVEMRGRMNSISGVFTSVMFSGSPLVFELFIRSYGWRGAWIHLAWIVGLAFPVFVYLFYRNTPETCDLEPDGGIHLNKKNDSTPVVEEKWVLSDAKKTFTFWIFNISTAMFSLFITAVTFHIVSIFETAGQSRLAAISIFLPSSIISIFMNLISGWLIDWKPFYYKIKYLLIAMLVGLGLVGIGVLTIEAGLGKILIILGNGAAGGLFGNIVSVSFPRFFGRTHLGEISGFNMSYLVFFSAIGPSILGWSFAQTGSYAPAIWGCLVSFVVLIALSFKADKPVLNQEKL